MDASILLIGSDRFRNFVFDLIRDLATFTVEVAANPFEALPLIQAQQPDLLLVQASQADSVELCRQTKSQNRLAWIYCIVIDEQTQDSLKQIETETHALTMGADAYLSLPIDAPTLSQRVSQNHLLQAYVKAGLRRVQNHRELMRANDVLSAIALSDPLTELNNRRAFEWELPRQIQNARNRKVPISLLMLDVDFFKRINDTYGHLTGDAVLRLLSARLRHNLRFYDTPFRYGGEEFVIVLSDTCCQEADRIANRICQLISEQPFAIDDALDLTITISAGVATLQEDDDAKGTSLLQRADQRLLQAKALGRNRVVGSSNSETDSLTNH
ncbi:GGDEF domain-containing protein [filamentous cyanobacterium CCP1]|nr:GGDEF domain-containing protein [filamentous cyanobacterium CCP2]PSB67436.1 GGDEF domain-containing protein [filamentous cyanobacterium CCP1]